MATKPDPLIDLVSDIFAFYLKAAAYLTEIIAVISHVNFISAKAVTAQSQDTKNATQFFSSNLLLRTAKEAQNNTDIHSTINVNERISHSWA